jgi:hypothetical protein
MVSRNTVKSGKDQMRLEQRHDRQQHGQQKYKLLLIGLMVIILLIIAFFLGVQIFGWDWTGFTGYNPPTPQYQRSKTLWDWMSLLIIPVALAILVFFFNRSERRNEQTLASDNQREQAIPSRIVCKGKLFKKGFLLG